MKTATYLCLVFFSAFSFGCKAQKGLLASRAHRFERTLRKKSLVPYVSGYVYRIEQSGVRQIQLGASVLLDKASIITVDDTGHYALLLSPGYHTIRATYVGSSTDKIDKLKVQAGDSIRLDFYLTEPPFNLHQESVSK